MYSYKDLLQKLNLEDNPKNRFYLKCIIRALNLNGEVTFFGQLINVDIKRIEYLLYLLNELKEYFAYDYNNKNDLIYFLYYIINDYPINLMAIFCPGYTDEGGYKGRIGENNTKRIITLSNLQEVLIKLKIKADMHLFLADIFLENTDYTKNPRWYNELCLHRKLFISLASNYFDIKDVSLLSSIFDDYAYLEGFINPDLEKNKTYQNFLKDNLAFYHKMGWNEDETIKRNDRLYTIYKIIGDYIREQKNGIYLPMETMYKRSKVMTSDKTCTMYLHK